MAAWTHYWTVTTCNMQAERPRGTFIHTASDWFLQKGVRKGDRVFGVNILRGKLRVIGGLTVDAVLTQAAAEKRLRNDDLWDADDHLVAASGSATNEYFDLYVPDDITHKLRFFRESGVQELAYADVGVLDRQALRGVAKLTAESAALLEKVLDDRRREDLWINDPTGNVTQYDKDINKNPLFRELIAREKKARQERTKENIKLKKVNKNG